MKKIEKISLIQAMKISISEVLEKMFFLPLDFDDSNTSGALSKWENNETLAAKLAFTGLFGGYFLLFIPKDLAAYATANFLGKKEDDVTQEEVTGTVCEIINMITGNSFSAFNSQMVINLGVPEMVSVGNVLADLKRTQKANYVSINTLRDSHLTLASVIHS